MGALQVMQEVGKKWQAMSKEERRYFKEKADKDKIRYLEEQKEFYDEVEKIGLRVGTTTSREGHVIVATATPTPHGDSLMNKNNKMKLQKANLNENSAS